MEDRKKEIIKIIIGIIIAILFTVLFWLFMKEDFANSGRFESSRSDENGNNNNSSESQELVTTEKPKQQENAGMNDNTMAGEHNGTNFTDIITLDPTSTDPMQNFKNATEVQDAAGTGNVNVKGLEEFYIPNTVPDGWTQDHIQINRDYVAIFYRPQETTEGEFDWKNNVYYSFGLIRDVKDSELKDRLLAIYGDDYEKVVQEERDHYIIDDVEKNTKYVYWAQRGKSHFATMPLDVSLDDVKSFCRTEIERVIPWHDPTPDGR